MARIYKVLFSSDLAEGTGVQEGTKKLVQAE